MGIGSYVHTPMPVDAEDIVPYDQAPIMPSQLPFTEVDWEPVQRISDGYMKGLKDAKISDGMNGMFSFTVDTFPLVGEWKGLKGFWVAEAVWATHAVGVARATAEWIVDGHPTLPIHEFDVNRFEPHQLGPSHIKMRSEEHTSELQSH